MTPYPNIPDAHPTRKRRDQNLHAGYGNEQPQRHGRCGCQETRDPAAVIIVLGGNDMLRGLDPAATRTNLDAIITQLKQRNVTVMLAGMLASRNLGPEYVTAFDGLYPALAETHNIDFYPFFLEGVALDPALNLSDGLHPNEDGVNEIVRRILPFVTNMLDQMAG